jgi:hypothetical protein
MPLPWPWPHQPWVPQFTVSGECSICGAIVPVHRVKHSAFHGYIWRLVAGDQAVNDGDLAALRAFFARVDESVATADRG